MSITYQEERNLVEKFNVAARKVIASIDPDYVDTFQGTLWYKHEDESVCFEYSVYDFRAILTVWEDGEFETYTEGELKDDVDPLHLLIERGFLALVWIIATQKPKLMPKVMAGLIEQLIEEV
jgi:hypothetical protein